MVFISSFAKYVKDNLWERRRPEIIHFCRVEQPRPRSEKKRVWASLEKKPEEVLQEAFEEVAFRDPAYQKKWVER